MKIHKIFVVFLLCCATTGAIVVGWMTVNRPLAANVESGDPEIPSNDETSHLLRLACDADYAKASFWDTEADDMGSRTSQLTSGFVTAAVREAAEPPCLFDADSEDVAGLAGDMPRSGSDVDTTNLVEHKTAQFPPQPLPLAANAVAISEQTRANEVAAQVVREAMPNSTRAEQEIWTEQLKGMNPDEMRFLLDQRQQFALPMSQNSSLESIVVPSRKTRQPELRLNPESMGSDPAGFGPVSSTDSLESAARILAANIANSSTVGYRQRILLFSPRRQAGGDLFTVRIGHSAGRILETNRQLDLAIAGPGFFSLTDSKGETFYCRSAPFVLLDGQIILDEATDTNPLVLVNGVPEATSRISIGDDGNVKVNVPGSERQTVGQLQVVTFLDASQLKPVGQSLFQATKRSGKPVVDSQKGQSVVLQGKLEGSNVDIDRQHMELQSLQMRKSSSLQHAGFTVPQ